MESKIASRVRGGFGRVTGATGKNSGTPQTCKRQ